MIIITGALVAAQQPPARVAHRDPIELIYADLMTYEKGPNIREVSGNVKFRQGDVEATCNRAVEHLDENRVELIGNVVITQQRLVLKAPLINYNGETRIADAFQGVSITDQKSVLTAKKGKYSTATLVADFTEDVKIEDDSATIWADRIVYYKMTRNSSAFGNVLIQGKFTNALLSGDTILHFPSLHYTRAYSNPILYQIDTVDALKIRTTDRDDPKAVFQDSISKFYYLYNLDTLSVSSDTMEAFRGINQEFYTFTNNVEITRGSIAAIAQKAVYDKRDEYISLMNIPVVWYDSTQLHGDSIAIQIPGRKVKLIHSIRNALAASRDDTLDIEKVNQILSDEITITFANDSINGINGYGNSKSLYFYTSEDGEDGASRVGSDTIMIDFKDGEAENIKWLGAIQGEYIPIASLSGSAQDLYLPDYRWHEERPVKKIISSRNAEEKKVQKKVQKKKKK